MNNIESHAKHQYLIADKFLSWGWKKKEIQSIKPVGNIKIITKKSQKIEKRISKDLVRTLFDLSMNSKRFGYEFD